MIGMDLEALFRLMTLYEMMIVMKLILLFVIHVYLKKMFRSEIARASRALLIPNEQSMINCISYEGDRNSKWDLRMDFNAFIILCRMLEVYCRLSSDGHVSVKEKVCIFFRVLTKNKSYRDLHIRFITFTLFLKQS